MTKRFVGLSFAVLALAVSATAGYACEEQAQAAEANDAKDAKAAVASADEKGCDMPCCAHAKTAANDKVAANEQGAVNAADEKPCAAHAGKACPKKAAATAATVAKTEPAQEAAKPEPPSDPGTNR